MTHDFLLKAKSNPDLQDFCEYLIKPLQILEELEYRYKNLPLDAKVKHINMALHLKVEKILNQYLPNMVDNYCDFSFKYRNEHFVKTIKTKDGEISYTAKEVLLQNLAKLIEEIHILEEDFNENNKFKLLVQEKILTNLGYSTDLDKTPTKIVLENKFKYKEDIFKKSIKESSSLENLLTTHKKEIIKNKPFYLNKSFEILLVFSFVFFCMFIMIQTGSMVSTQVQGDSEGRKLAVLAQNTRDLYIGKTSYEGLSNKILLKTSSANDMVDPVKNDIASRFGGITVKSIQEGKQFEVTYNDIPAETCEYLVNGAQSQFEKIMIGDYTIKDNKENIILDQNKLKSVCNLKNIQNASLVFTSN